MIKRSNILWTLVGVLIITCQSVYARMNTFQDSVYLEAESGIVEAPMQVFNDPEASNGQYVKVLPGNESNGAPPPNGKVSLQVSLSAGTYKIWGRVITPSGSEDSFWVQVNDGTAYRWNSIGDFTKWTWAAVHDSDDNANQVEWTLEEGVHTINVYYREEGAQLDEIYITRFGDTPTKGDVVVKRTIHVSQELGDDSNEGTESSPIRTLFKAYQIAQATQEEVTSYEILLRGGETYDDFQPIFGLDEGGGPTFFGFVWNINRKLKLSTYGPDHKAHLLGSKHKHEGGPTQGVLVINPSTEDVLIENLFFEMWQEGALMTFETEDVHIRNIKIDKIGTYYFPAEETLRSSESYPYTAGVVYPKNSTRILMEYIEISNCHNIFEDVTNLHGFYGTRLNQSEIRNCTLRNVSGSPFKFRRSQANNVYIHDNASYYTGHTEFEGSWAQPGFLRYSGDPGGNCPFSLTFENNIFHYPFCWSEYGEDCEMSEAILCSVSNTTSCGEGACTDPERVEWINNDIIYGWVPGQQTELPTTPFNLIGDSKSENSITLDWYDININENGFVVEKMVDGTFMEVARLSPNTQEFNDEDLNPSTTYQYRVYAENKLGRSEYSESISITTRAPNSPPVPIIKASVLEGLPPLEVRFNANESFDPDGDSFIYAWLVNDDFKGNRDTLTYVFEEVGTYTVTLVLEDGKSKGETSVEVIVDLPLSVSQGINEDINIYPNPTDGHFSISSDLDKVSITVLDFLGQPIETFVNRKNGINSYSLAPGAYLVLITTNSGKRYQRKLIVTEE